MSQEAEADHANDQLAHRTLPAIYQRAVPYGYIYF